MSTDLWADRRREHLGAAEPLAVRMRPVRLDQFVGQQHFLGPGKLLRRMLEADQLTSVIFYGPPGCGKTSLAEVIANHTNRRFERANAASVGVRDVREVLDRARENLEMDGKQAILFLDEIHRFNRAQQDILLGDVERGVMNLQAKKNTTIYWTASAKGFGCMSNQCPMSNPSKNTIPITFT